MSVKIARPLPEWQYPVQSPSFCKHIRLFSSSTCITLALPTPDASAVPHVSLILLWIIQHTSNNYHFILCLPSYVIHAHTEHLIPLFKKTATLPSNFQAVPHTIQILVSHKNMQKNKMLIKIALQWHTGDLFNITYNLRQIFLKIYISTSICHCYKKKAGSALGFSK